MPEYCVLKVLDADRNKTLDQIFQEYGPIKTVATLVSDIINNSGVLNTLQDITNLSFPVSAGLRYRFRFVIFYSSAASTTGSRWTINGPATTLLNYRSEYTLTATSKTINEGLTAYNLPAACNASSLTTGNMAIIEGTITPSATGNVIGRFASEIASSAITVKPHSYVTYERY